MIRCMSRIASRMSWAVRRESVVGEATFRALGAKPLLLSAAEMSWHPESRVDGMDLFLALHCR